MTTTPNTAQYSAIEQGYGSAVVSWEVKRNEYDNEDTPVYDGGGYAMVATLKSGWRVTVGRYGAILAEYAPIARP